MNINDYKPISDYGIIGNLTSVALIARDGSIDWCCLPRMDSPSVFGAILDARRGGFFRIGPAGGGRGSQEYVEESNVLKTSFTMEGAVLTVTDFMPLEGDIEGRNDSCAPPEIHRLIECHGSFVDVEIIWCPRFDYAGKPVVLERCPGGWIARSREDAMRLEGLEMAEPGEDDHGPLIRAALRINPGESKAIVTRWGAEDAKNRVETADALASTLEAWRGWLHQKGSVNSQAWAGDRINMLIRSALVIKLLCIGDQGSIAAAPTTSLPEEIGGVRNWDYRYAWIRDGAMTGQALISIGHKAEAVDLLHWFEEVSKLCKLCHRELQIMYGLHGEKDLPEQQLPHLEGYKGSRPVNIGNEAHGQFQLEVFGELVSTAYELVRRGHPLTDDLSEFIAWIADHVVEVWQSPDFGIWEVRGEARHFVYSKVMAWVALDKALLLAKHFNLKGNVALWDDHRTKIREQVMENGFDPQLNAFVQSYGSREMDAANLRLALVEFLPADDPKIQGTVNRIMEELMSGCLIRRYRAEDGLPGHEGAFGLCTFWLVDVLALSGRIEEAERIFSNIVRYANHLGLFSEQLDPETGDFLGNFPQAFTHIGLINSILYLAYAKGVEVPVHDPIGTAGHREFRNSLVVPEIHNPKE
jgi:GH15 family glucan-1,4-alpha-glucosidase